MLLVTRETVSEGTSGETQVLRTGSLSYYYLTPSGAFTAPAAHSIPGRFTESEYNMREYHRFLAEWSHSLALNKLIADRTDPVVPGSDGGLYSACNHMWQRDVGSIADQLVEMRHGFERLFDITIHCMRDVR
ncbi:MAG: hypothetical protein Q9173_003348 [Seirophora scorigena]